MKVIVPNKLDFIKMPFPEENSVDGTNWRSDFAYKKNQMARANHITFVSLDDNNKGNDPVKTWSGENAKWKKLNATMPYRMLDGYVETQTVAKNGEPLSFSVPFNRADSFALFNMTGYQAKVKIYDLDENPAELAWPEEPYLTNGWALTADISSLSLHEYNYSLIVSNPHLYFTDIPLQINGRLEVEILSEEPAALGHIVVGRERTLGLTEYSAELGFIDYSRKTTDEFGHTTLTRRSFASSMSLPLYLHPNRADYVHSILTSIRGIPCAWIGDNYDGGFKAMLVYGWLEDFRMVYEGPSEMRLALEIQGLI